MPAVPKVFHIPDELRANFKLGKRLGEGTYGVAHVLECKTTGQLFAAKQMTYRDMTPKEKECVFEEMRIHPELNHAHIVKAHSTVHDRVNQRIYIVMEYCSGGSLLDHIQLRRKEGRYFDEGQIWVISGQIIAGMLYLHHPEERGATPAGVFRAPTNEVLNFPILHRDLKAGNVFTDRHLVKIGDLGMSRVMSSGLTTGTYCGTWEFMAPELLREDRYGRAVDLWALGCLMYELITLRLPFDEATLLKLGSPKGALGYRPPVIPAHYSRSLQDVINSLLHLDPKYRMDIKALANLYEVRIALRDVATNSDKMALQDERRLWAAEQARQKIKVEAEQARLKAELEAKFSRQLELEKSNLEAKVEAEVARRVQASLARQMERAEGSNFLKRSAPDDDDGEDEPVVKRRKVDPEVVEEAQPARRDGFLALAIRIGKFVLSLDLDYRP